MPVNNGYPFLQAFWNSPQINSPGTVVSDASSTGSAAWSNTSNAIWQTNSYATASIGASGFGSDDDYSEYLWATNFNFTIPEGATIRGILVEVDKSVASGVAVDWKAQLIKGGSIVTENKADTVTDWGTDTNEYVQYGGETDLWGTTWTPADINASNFGFAIAAEGDAADISNANVDHIMIRVYYDLPIIEEFTFDAYIKQVFTEAFTTDAYIKGIHTEAVTFDSYVKGIQSESFTFDAIIVERTPGGVFTFDAYLKAIDYYVLDDLILPRPKHFRRGFVVTKTDVLTLGGRTGRDIIARKEKFILGWEYLSKTEIDDILSKVDLNIPLNFRVYDRDLIIRDRLVIPYVASISYDIPGSSYIGRLQLELIAEG